MLLRVKNLGPVREAELDLGKPLIVLTGPNNSGKTYLAWAAYSLARLDSEIVEPPPAIGAWVERLFESKDQTLDTASLLDTRDDVLRAVAKAIRDKVPEDFAASDDRFIQLVIELASANDDEPTLVKQHGIRIENLIFFLFSGDGRTRIQVYDRPSNRTKPPNVSIADLSKEQLKQARNAATKLAIRALMDALFEQDCAVLPAERLAVNLFARELAAERTELVDELLIDVADPEIIREKLQHRARRYPLAIRDALQVAIRLSSNATPGPLHDLAEEIEENILGGRIKLDAFDEPSFIPAQDPNKKPLGLHESASVVKSLVSLVLHLRYEARAGQRLIIDEPELNLHPDNQRLVARILAKAVNRGLKIMMSTHSDYIIRELNNLVMLGQDSDKARALAQELGYQPEQTLRPEQIGAYLVNDGACTRLDITETGFETKTIEDEIHKLNQDAQTIYLRLFCD